MEVYKIIDRDRSRNSEKRFFSSELYLFFQNCIDFEI